jgi:GAF domain-containing protein
VRSIFTIGLRGKLYLIIILSFLVLFAVLTLATSRYLEGLIRDQYVHTAQSMATFIEANLSTSTGQLPTAQVQRELEALGRDNPEISRISVYGHSEGKGYEVLASSDPAIVGRVADENDIRAIESNQGFVTEKFGGEEEESPNVNEVLAAQNGQASDADFDHEPAKKELELVEPMHDPSGNVIAAVGVHLDMSTRDNLVVEHQKNFALITSLGLLALLPLLYMTISRMVIKPVKQLTRASRNIGDPDWSPPESLERRDEIGDLARAFNETSNSLTARDQESKLLLEASVAVSSALQVDRILQIVCEKISSSRMVTYCRVSLLDDSGKNLIVRAATPTRNMSEWERGLGQALDLADAPQHAHVIASGNPVVMRKRDPAPGEDSSTEWKNALTPETQSALLLPLVCKDETIGVVTLGEVRQWSRTPFSDQKIEFYQTLMNQTSVAIENARLYEKTEWHVRELSVMHNMSQAFTSTLDYQEVVSVVAQRVGSLIGAEFASVLLPDERRQYLNIVASYNLDADYIWTINRKRRIPIGVGPLGKAFSMSRPFVVSDVLTEPDYGLWKHIASVQGYSSLIALPLMAKDQSIGVICIYFKEPRRLRDDEISLLTTSANEAAIAIDNARIYENLQDAFVGTIRSLAETIDAKDAYTRGHSERVSLYAEAIARTLNLQEDELKTIRYAGYLHDVGKIGIPDAILTKPGKLSADEYRVIMKHPVLSEKILAPVNFPFPVQSIVRHHHERFDGQGYPDNLSGEEIPLGARILFVADAYEAMTSDRPYRQALSSEKALCELQSNVGTQFDARVVTAFTKIIASEQTSERTDIRLGA